MQGTPGVIPQNVLSVRDTIWRAAIRGGRDPDTIRLIAATKSVTVERMREAVSAGVAHLGENRLQEALPKIGALKGLPITWHFIGRLQRRKVKDVLGRFTLIHSVDTVALAQEIDRRAGQAGIKQPVLVEVNLGGEVSKGGVLLRDLDRLIQEMDGMPNLSVQGLMTIPPFAGEAEAARPFFRQLRELASRLSHMNLRAIHMKELSMGMSTDYEVAVEEGATFVRVGTAIFGSRHA